MTEQSSIDPAVRPDQIKISAIGTVGKFGKCEVEVAAAQLVQYFQSRGQWEPFTLQQLMTFYQLKGWDLNLFLFGLLGYWFDEGDSGSVHCPQEYIIQFPNGEFEVTELFKKICNEK